MKCPKVGDISTTISRGREVEIKVTELRNGISFKAVGLDGNGNRYGLTQFGWIRL